MKTAQNNPDLKLALQSFWTSLPDFIEITTPDTPGTELAIRHGLGRKPIGYMVVNGPYKWLNIGYGDTEWTRDTIYLKFSLDSTELTVAVW